MFIVLSLTPLHDTDIFFMFKSYSATVGKFCKYHLRDLRLLSRQFKLLPDFTKLSTLEFNLFLLIQQHT